MGSLKKEGGAFIRVGASNRTFTVFRIIITSSSEVSRLVFLHVLKMSDNRVSVNPALIPTDVIFRCVCVCVGGRNGVVVGRGTR